MKPNGAPDHAIPSLTHLGVCTILKGGGAELHIVIASPLQDDECSLRRLLGKIEAYLGHIQSAAFVEEAGEPSASNTKVVVNIHRDSCQEAFSLLERSSAWVADNRASLEVRILEEP